MTHSTWLLRMLNMTLAGLLGACTDTPNQALQQWMAEQKIQMRKEVPPVTAPQAFAPERDDPMASPDPFSRKKMGQGMAPEPQASAANRALIAPELARPKEALEAVALDQLRLVGTLTNADQVVALVQHKQMLYQVRTGNYLGLNYGRITRIDEKSLSLREMLPTLNGGWVASQATLVLQEKTP